MDKLIKKFKFPEKKPDLSDKLDGWLGDGNQLLLKKYLTKDTKLVIEFGSWLGLSADFIMRHTSKNCILICVDWWKGDTSIGYHKDPEYLYNQFLVNVWQYKKQIVPVRMDGREAIKYLSELELNPDLIYLDMDHSYESAKGDLKLLMKYFPETLILGDDILFWPGVAKAVKEIVREHKLTNLEINKNSYALVPTWYSKKYRLKDIIMKTIKPKDQFIDYKIAVIVGYKKELHTTAVLERFITYMTDFMKKTGAEFKIFVMHQVHQSGEFNLGRLYNTGFEIAENEGYGKFIFHDLNLLPDESMVDYYKRDNKYPIQLGYHWDKFNYEVFYLGSMMFNKENYELINGYPSNVEGWNGWDNEIVLRLKTTQLTLRIPAEGKLIKNGDKPDLSIKQWRRYRKSNIINAHEKTWKKNGLNNTYYEIVNNKRVNDNCSIYTLNLFDEKYYLGNLEPIDKVISDVKDVKDTDIEIDFKFTSEPIKQEKKYGFIEQDKELIEKYTQISKQYDLSNILFPYSFLLDSKNMFYYKQFEKKFNFKQTFNNKIIEKYDIYSYELINNITSTFDHIKNKKLKYLHINALNLQNIEKNKIISESDRYINNLSHYLKSKHNKKYNIEYKGVYSLSYYNNPDFAKTSSKYKIELKSGKKSVNEIYNNLCTYNDYLKLVKHCNGKFDLLYISYAFTKTYVSDVSISILQYFYLIICVLKLSEINSSCLLRINTMNLNTKTFYDFIFILKNYYKSFKLCNPITNNITRNNLYIICDNFKGVSKSTVDKYELLLKNNYTDSLYNNIISNKNSYNIHSLLKIDYRLHYSFVNEITNFIQKLLIERYTFYTKLIYLNQLSEKEIKIIIKKLYRIKERLYYKYLKDNMFITLK